MLVAVMLSITQEQELSSAAAQGREDSRGRGWGEGGLGFRVGGGRWRVTCSALANRASAALGMPARSSMRTAASHSCCDRGFFCRPCSSFARALRPPAHPCLSPGYR